MDSTNEESSVSLDDKIVKKDTDPLIPKLAPRPKITLQQLFDALNTENNWALMLGLFWYAIVLACTAAGLDSGHMFKWHSGDILGSFSLLNIVSLLLMMSFTIISLLIVHRMLDKPLNIYKYLTTCVIIFGGEVIGTFDVLYNVGMGTAIWCIIFGIIFRLLVKDTSGFLSMDFYIKVSVVLLAVDMTTVGAIGPKGLVVGWVETSVIFILVILFGIFVVKSSSAESMVVSGCLSICGSSAAIAINDILKIDAELQKYIISIMSIATVPFIPIIPILGNTFHFNNNTIGAWIGGCIDTTGAVSASASLTNQDVVHAAIIVKMIQNVWIVPIVIGVSLYHTRSFSLKMIWDNFPKFVLGFIITGLITTFLPDNLRTTTANNSFVVSEWFSAISFVIIGFEIDILTLPKKLVENKKILLIYGVGQLLDTFTTLGMAFLMFTVAK